MTAIIVGQEADAIHIFTDGALVADDGKLLGAIQKVHLVGHLPAVVAGAGSPLWPSWLYVDACRCSSFDQLIDDLVSILRSYERNIDNAPGGAQLSKEFEIFVAGYSDLRGRLECFKVRNHEKGGSGENWQLAEVEGDVLMPSPSASALESIQWHGGTPLVSVDGPQIMLAQRLTPGPYPDGKGHGCVVGGFLQHTVLTPDNVTSRVVHRWSDEVGKLLDA
jgi:hypothetical protein